MKIHHTDGNVYYLDFKRECRKKDGAIKTICQVWKKIGFNVGGSNKPQIESVGIGVCCCHPNDKFDRDRGRRIALDRALGVYVEKALILTSGTRKHRLDNPPFDHKSRKEFFRQYDEYIEGSKEAVFRGKTHPGDVLNA